MTELYQPALELINQKYTLLLRTDVRKFDENWQVLSDQLDTVKKKLFLPNERILIAHMDTDYYDVLLPYGLVVINLIRMFKNKDIPLYLLLFVTNHYGIQKEFDSLLANQSEHDRPTIIETLLSAALLSNNFSLQQDCKINQIEKAGMSMMGRKRSHRVALCNFIVDSQLLDCIALKTNF